MKAVEFTFPEEERLKHKKLFESLFATGKRSLKHPVLAVWQLQPLSKPGSIQIGISVPKKHFKTAVQRNLIKRWIRESYRTQNHPLKSTLAKTQQSLVILFITLKTDNNSYEAFRPKIHLLLQAIEQEISNVE